MHDGIDLSEGTEFIQAYPLNLSVGMEVPTWALSVQVPAWSMEI